MSRTPDSPDPPHPLSPILVLLATVVLGLAIAAALIGVQRHGEARALILGAARTRLEGVDSAVGKRVQAMLDEARAGAATLTSLPALRQEPRGETHPALPALHRLLEGSRELQRAFALFSNGTTLRLIRLDPRHPAESKALGGPPDAHWGIHIRMRDRDNRFWTLWRFEDGEGAIVAARLEEGDDPAAKKDDPAWVDSLRATKGVGPPIVRRSPPDDLPTLTVAGRIRGAPRAVAGVEIAMPRLTRLLGALAPSPSARLMLVAKDGTPLASHAGGGTTQPVEDDAVLGALGGQLAASQEARSFDLDVDGQEWLVRLSAPLDATAGMPGTRIAIAVPAAEAVASLVSATQRGLWLAAPFLALALLIGLIAVALRHRQKAKLASQSAAIPAAEPEAEPPPPHS
ncbi:cache domain-containing protein [Rhodospirillum rubrum]|uniref:cache domain-containing protein n=1 Tax=Rhodospirillum rubrum TaxID=1085 RepID=UPI00190861A2|nr:cache domain-containing protein [Rhodospirillum rubrum]